LRLALILDLADDELDLFVDPVIALEAVSTRERAAVGGVNRQPRPVIEGEIWLFELALSPTILTRTASVALMSSTLRNRPPTYLLISIGFSPLCFRRTSFFDLATRQERDEMKGATAREPAPRSVHSAAASGSCGAVNDSAGSGVAPSIGSAAVSSASSDAV